MESTTKTAYLDNAATTPVRPEVLDAMLPYLAPEGVGNPSSAHRFGREAKQAVATAREQIALALGAEPNQVIFTAGGTEADNLAVVGGALAARDAGRPFAVAVSAVEHPGVLEAAYAVERMGGKAIVLPVDESGQVERDALRHALQQGLALVSAMWVNNEVGLIQDIAALADICLEYATPLHTDAVQAVGKIPCTMQDIPLHFLAIAGHKIGAPQGIGAAIVKDRQAVHCITHGGGQQFGLRSGTENVPGIVALGVAVELSVQHQQHDAAQYGALRDFFETKLREIIPNVEVIGARGPRAPHISNVAIPGIDSEAMVMHLDLAGIACSAGSACHTGTVEPSRVLTAIGIPHDLATRSLRFSVYKQTTQTDVQHALDVIPGIVNKVRGLATTLGR